MFFCLIFFGLLIKNQTGSVFSNIFAADIIPAKQTSAEKSFVEQTSAKQTTAEQKSTEKTSGEKIPEGYKSLFDGKSLRGWKGDPKFWSVQEGCIVGQSTKETPVPYSTFLVWEGEPVKDFVLLVKFRILEGNTGIEYRAWNDPKREFGLNGYQADISPGEIMGIVYGENLGEIIAWRGESAHFNAQGVKTVTKFADQIELAKSINMNGWNVYRIEAKNNKFIQYINDVKMSELLDERPDSPKQGIFGLQIHPGPPMKFMYKDIYLKVL